MGMFVVGCLVIAFAALLAGRSAGESAAAAPFMGTANDPAVSAPITLHNRDLHPQQLAYDARRDGLWFWTSTQDRGVTFDNRVYFYDIAAKQLRSWPIYSPDWSSQLLAGLAVAPNGDVWIGWNLHLVDFHPADGTYSHYELPAQARYSLPARVLGGLPANLGVADLAVAHDGTVWIARYAALSLTAFDPASATFSERPLPASSGDPAKLAIGAAGHIIFTTDFSADHPGYIYEKVGEYDPGSGQTHIYPQSAKAVAVTGQGDIYAAMDGHGASLARLSAGARASAEAAGRAPDFAHGVVPFDVDGAALAVDPHGRVWMAVAGRPDIAVLDPATGQIQQFQYAAPSIAAHSVQGPLGSASRPAGPNDVVLVHMAAMTTDAAGHLWYIRAGSDAVEEVAA